MKRHLIALALGALFSLPAVAAGNDRPSMTLAQAVTRVESLFPGEVIAADYDASEHEPGHYHVHLRLNHGPILRLEVDRATGNLLHTPRDPDRIPDAQTVSRLVDRLGAIVPGRVNVVEFDDTNPADPHYHVRVTAATGFVYSLRVDPAMVNLGWREAGPRPR